MPERLRGVITTRRYTNPRLPLPLPLPYGHLSRESLLASITRPIIIIIFIRHNMTGQQGTECTNSSPTKCNKIKDIKTLYT